MDNNFGNGNEGSSFSGGLKLAGEPQVQPEQPIQPEQPVQPQPVQPEQMFRPQGQPEQPFQPQGQQPFQPQGQSEQAQPSAGGFTLAPQEPVYSAQPGAGAQPGMNAQPGFGGQPGMNAQPGFGGQPGMNGQPGFGGQQIYGGVNPGLGGGPTPPKKSKKGLIIGLSVAAVAIAAIVCFCIFLLPKLLNPKKKIEAALKETLNHGAQITALEDQIGSGDVVKKLLKDGGTIDTKFNIDSIAGQNVGAGIAFDFTRDNAAKKLSADVGVNYGDKSLLTVAVKADADKLYVSIPELIDGSFTLPTQNILQALSNSPLAEGLNLNLSALPPINIDLYQSIELGDAENMLFENELWDKASFKSKGSKSISVNGTEVKAKMYEVTIAEADIEEAVSSAIETAMGTLMNNPAVASLFGVDSSQMSMVISQVKAMVPTIIGGDIVFNVYVKDGSAIKIETKGSWNIFGAALDYNFFMDDMDNHTFFSATLGAAGQNITLTSDSVATADSLKTKVNLGAAGQSIEANVDVKVSGSNIDGTASIGAGGQSIDAAFKGTVKDASKGDKFTLEFSDLTVTASGQEVLKMSGYVTMDATNKNVGTVDASAKQYDITSMGEEDFKNIVEDNKDKIQEWTKDLQGMFGGLGGITNPGDFDGDDIFPGGLDDDGKEPGEDVDVEEVDPEDLNEEIAPEDMVVGSEDGKVTVQVNGPGEGWECFYAGGMVSFMDADGNDINYTLESGDDVKKILDERVLLDGEEASEFEDSKVDSCLEKEIDGKKVIYSVGAYKAKPDSSFGDTTITILAAVVEVGDGQYLMASTTTWSEDGLKIDDILNALKSSCYTVK